MTAALLTALVVAILVFGLLMLIERWWHNFRKSDDRSYRWGVWLFALLAGVYAFLTSLGR